MNDLYCMQDSTINHEDYENVKDMFKVMDRNMDILQAQDQEAIKNNTLVGRLVSIGVADGYAHYQVIKEYKKTVRIMVCQGLGDDWIDRRWGWGCSIPKEEALRFMRGHLPSLKSLI